MEKKNRKYITLLFLLLIIICLSVGFAAFNTNLTINGVGKVLKSSWDIHFSNLSLVENVGEATEITAPVLTSTNITGFSVSLRKPNDSITYRFSVVNSGDYDAKISSINMPIPTCTGTGSSATTDANNVCKYLKYTLTYLDGSNVNVNDTLDIGESREMVLKLTYKDNNIVANELAKSDVTINNLKISINYSQV